MDLRSSYLASQPRAGRLTARGSQTYPPQPEFSRTIKRRTAGPPPTVKSQFREPSPEAGLQTVQRARSPGQPGGIISRVGQASGTRSPRCSGASSQLQRKGQLPCMRRTSYTSAHSPRASTSDVQSTLRTGAANDTAAKQVRPQHTAAGSALRKCSPSLSEARSAMKERVGACERSAKFAEGLLWKLEHVCIHASLTSPTRCPSQKSLDDSRTRFSSRSTSADASSDKVSESGMSTAWGKESPRMRLVE